MTTRLEQTPEGVIYRAAKTCAVPDVDILTLLFGTSKLRSKSLHHLWLGSISMRDVIPRSNRAEFNWLTLTKLEIYSGEARYACTHLSSRPNSCAHYIPSASPYPGNISSASQKLWDWCPRRQQRYLLCHLNGALSASGAHIRHYWCWWCLFRRICNKHCK